MTNYEMILQINDKARENIKKIKTNDKIDKINECLSFTDIVVSRFSDSMTILHCTHFHNCR